MRGVMRRGRRNGERARSTREGCRGEEYGDMSTLMCCDAMFRIAFGLELRIRTSTFLARISDAGAAAASSSAAALPLCMKVGVFRGYPVVESGWRMNCLRTAARGRTVA